MLQTTYEPINLGIRFDLIDLLLTSGGCGTPGACPALFKPPFQRECVLPGACLKANWAGSPGVGFLLVLVIWFIPIHTSMSYSLDIGYSGGRKCKVCCLDGLCHIRNTLNIYTTLQQHYSTSLIYEQDYIAEVLGKTVV